MVGETLDEQHTNGMFDTLWSTCAILLAEEEAAARHDLARRNTHVQLVCPLHLPAPDQLDFEHNIPRHTAICFVNLDSEVHNAKNSNQG